MIKGFPLILLFLLSACAAPAPPVPPAEDVVHRLVDLGDYGLDASTDGRWYDLSENLGGVQVSLLWVYTDGKRAFVSYHIDSPPGQDNRSIRPMLVTMQGQSWIWKGEFGVTGPSDLLDVHLPLEDGVYLAEFLIEEPLGEVETVDLRFTMVLERFPHQTWSPTRGGFAERLRQWFTPGSGRGRADLQPVEMDPMPQLGPFLFEFTLPVNQD
jgi:hypothetical protein